MTWQFFVAIIVVASWIFAVVMTISFVSGIIVSREPEKLDQYDWYMFGVDSGYCTQYFCDTHDGIPMSEEEMVSWDEGNDDCYWVMRIIEIGQGEEDE